MGVCAAVLGMVTTGVGAYQGVCQKRFQQEVAKRPGLSKEEKVELYQKHRPPSWTFGVSALTFGSMAFIYIFVL